MERTASIGDLVKAGLIAGVVGAIAIELFYFTTMLPSSAGAAVAALLMSFRFTAAVLVGPSAYQSASAVPLGIVLHLCVSIGWALGFVWAVRSQPQLVRHPWISGAAFGLVVYVFMQIVLITAGVYHRAGSPAELTIQLVSHIVFFGIPVALVASRLLRGSSTPGRAV